MLFLIMLLIILFAGKYINYKTDCSSHHVEYTFLCMRPKPRGPTPHMTDRDDSQGTINVIKKPTVQINCVESEEDLKPVQSQN